MPFRSKNLLASTDYPLYCVKALDDRFFVTAGGGGCSKTGVDNSLAVYEIISENGNVFGKVISVIDMGLSAPMNMALCYNLKLTNEYFVALGLGELCKTFLLNRIIMPLYSEECKRNILFSEALELSNSGLHHRHSYSHNKSDTAYKTNGHLSSKCNPILKNGNGCVKNKQIRNGYIKNVAFKNEAQSVDNKNALCEHDDEDTGINDSELESHSSSSTESELEQNSLNSSNKPPPNAFHFKKIKNLPDCFESTFSLTPLHSATTDSSNVATGHQKTVKICAERKIIVTGATDGFIRIWELSTLKKLREIKAHNNEIDEVEIHPVYPHIVSLSRDGHAYVWNYIDGSQICELEWDIAQHYRFRACRFLPITSTPPIFRASTKPPEKHDCDDITPSSTYQPDNFTRNYPNVNYCNTLYTVHIPCRRSKVRQSCYISKWNLTDLGDSMIAYDCALTRVTSQEESYILAIDPTGHFLAIGTSDGSVSVYTSHNLRRVSHFPNAHDIFITGLDFIPIPTAFTNNSYEPKNLNLFGDDHPNKTNNNFNLSSDDKYSHPIQPTRNLKPALIHECPPYAAHTAACLLSISVDRKINLYRIRAPRSALFGASIFNIQHGNYNNITFAIFCFICFAILLIASYLFPQLFGVSL